MSDLLGLVVTFKSSHRATSESGEPPAKKRQKKSAATDADSTVSQPASATPSQPMTSKLLLFSAVKAIFDEGTSDLSGINNSNNINVFADILPNVISMVYKLGLSRTVNVFNTDTEETCVDMAGWRKCVDQKLVRFSCGWLAVNDFRRGDGRCGRDSQTPSSDTATAPIENATVSAQPAPTVDTRMKEVQLVEFFQWLKTNSITDHRSHIAFRRLSTSLSQAQLDGNLETDLRSLVRAVVAQVAASIPTAWTQEVARRLENLALKSASELVESDKIHLFFRDQFSAQAFLTWRANYIVDLVRFFCIASESHVLAALSGTEAKLTALVTMDNDATSTDELLHRWQAIVEYGFAAHVSNTDITDTVLAEKIDAICGIGDNNAGLQPQESPQLSPVASPSPVPTASPSQQLHGIASVLPTDLQEAMAADDAAEQPALEASADAQTGWPALGSDEASAEADAEEQSFSHDGKQHTVAVRTLMSAWYTQFARADAPDMKPAKITEAAYYHIKTVIDSKCEKASYPPGLRFQFDTTTLAMISATFTPTIPKVGNTDADAIATSISSQTTWKLYFGGHLFPTMVAGGLPVAKVGPLDFSIADTPFMFCLPWHIETSDSSDDVTLELKSDSVAFKDAIQFDNHPEPSCCDHL